MVCAISTCAADAVPDGQGFCSIHKNGQVKHDGSRDLHCARCSRPIKKNQWYQGRISSVRGLEVTRAEHIGVCPK